MTTMDRAMEPAEPSEGFSPEEEKLYVASFKQLMWWRFKKHRMALISLGVLIGFYFVVVFAEFVAPYDPEAFFVEYKLAPPTRIHIRDSQGNFHWPFVYKIDRERDPETLRYNYLENTDVILPINFFARGPEYSWLGLITTDIHLFGLDVPREEQGVFLVGADRLGRDLFSRVCYGARLSLTIGLVGVFLSLVIGVVLGGVSGYYGGTIDNVIQRTIEFIRTIPHIPLWMALSAALPADWPVARMYFGITIILSLVGWTWMARVVRGRFLSMREE
ncbi:MAG: ABC transporter permease, partial [Anaerolineae bacterium]